MYGQLIFSGYDTSRFTENAVSFTMADDLTRDLVVALQSIRYSGSSSATLLSHSIDIFIDSTDPNIWLPGDACEAFEKAFGLTLDSKTGLYLVNETHHNTLLDSNAEVSFRLSDVKSGGDTVTIVLPYAAFDLTAEYPLVDNSSYYFPLKRASNSTQYTLGRTFFQEACVTSEARIDPFLRTGTDLTPSSYLSADYERKVFNVSACVWNQGAQENIVTITSTDSDSATGRGSSPSGHSHLSGGAIADIVVACVIVGILLAVAIAYVILRKRRKWMKAGFAVAAPKPEPDEFILDGPVFNSSPHSTAYNSTPMSAADISAPRSTAECSRSAADSPARPDTIEENVAGSSTPELDGRDTLIRPNTELEGTEIQPVAKNPLVYELPGSEVVGGRGREAEPDRAPSTVGSLPSCDEREGGSDSPPSPFVSTLGTFREQDERADSDLVSPTTPTHHAARLF